MAVNSASAERTWGAAPVEVTASEIMSPGPSTSRCTSAVAPPPGTRPSAPRTGPVLTEIRVPLPRRLSTAPVPLSSS